MSNYVKVGEAAYTCNTKSTIVKNGELVELAVNEAGINEDGLQCYEAGTNDFIYSEIAIPRATWVTGSGVITETISGGFKTYHIVADAPARLDFPAHTIITRRVDTISCLARQGPTDTGGTRIKNRSLGPMITQGDTFKRYAYTEDGSGNRYIGFDIAVGKMDIYVQALQVEELPYSSPYIPTNGTAVTRAKTVTSISIDTVDWDNDFTIKCEFKVSNVSGLYAAVIGCGGQFSTNKGFALTLIETASSIGMRFRFGSGVADMPVPAFNLNTPVKVVMRKTASRIKIDTEMGHAESAYNGDFEVGSDINLGSDGNGNYQLNGSVKGSECLKGAITDAEVAAYVNS